LELLLDAFQDKDPGVRAEAILGSVGLGWNELRPAMEQAAKSDRETFKNRDRAEAALRELQEMYG
jgi:hypothetical protein